jgi:hypothetical protein
MMVFFQMAVGMIVLKKFMLLDSDYCSQALVFCLISIHHH